MADLKVIPVETDVLIIGGGLAGCMAAINAAGEEGVRVTLAEKSNTMASGCAGSGIDHLWSYIPEVHEPMGYTLEDMAEDHRQGIAYGLFRRDLFMLVASTMYDRMLDLERFGINFRYEDSITPGKFRVVPQFHSVPASFNFDGAPLKVKLTGEMRRRKVNIINRVQMTDLITSNGQVSGAVGVDTRTADIYFFKAKAVILSTGRSNRLGRNLRSPDFNTRIPSSMSGDGTVLAYRAGLPIVSIEFMSGGAGIGAAGNYGPNYGGVRNTVQPAARIVDGEGNIIVPRIQFFDWANLGKEKWTPSVRQKWLEERKAERSPQGEGGMAAMHNTGGGPFYLDFAEATDYEAEYIEWSIKNEGLGTQFMRYFKEEEGLDLRKNAQEYVGFFGGREISANAAKGLWVDKDLETTDLKNLFAAGDEVAGLNWSSGPGAVVQGWHAGGMAAKRASAQKALLPASEEPVKARKQMCSDILNRKRGFYWKEIEIGVQDIMDFYCGSVRSERLLSRGLDRLEDAKAAQMKADNPHELARSLDVKSIIDNAELVLRSSRERKETRLSPAGFRRADYPEQDDENWLCFLGIRKENGEFKFTKYPVDK